MSDIMIVGAGGHARALISLLKHLQHSVTGVIDNARYPSETIMGVPVCQPSAHTKQLIVVALGDNSARQRACNQWQSTLFQANLCHPRAYVDDGITTGIANQIFAFAMIGPEVQLGSGNIINTQAVVEHEVVIGDFNHIAAGATLLGRSRLGDRCFIGAGTVIRDGVTVSSDIVVGAQAYVSANIDEPGIYVGVPARRIR